MEVKELINDPEIWAGQNKPGLPMEDADDTYIRYSLFVQLYKKHI